MPSERFEKLSEEKKRRIREAALREFGATPMEDVSINRIIKEAGISRGSFYTYFESKADVLRYLSSEMQSEMEKMIGGLFLEYKGDFFAITERFAELIVERVQTLPKDLKQTHSALFSGFSTAENLLAFAKVMDNSTKEMDDELWLHCDRSRLRIKSREELKALSVQCRSMIMITVIRTMLLPDTAEENLQLFRLMLENIKTGVLV